MKLTYWYAKRLNDADCYSIRARTKKEAVRMLSEHDGGRFAPVVKVTIEYKDAFDLLWQINSSEGGLYEENSAAYHAIAKAEGRGES